MNLRAIPECTKGPNSVLDYRLLIPKLWFLSKNCLHVFLPLKRQIGSSTRPAVANGAIWKAVDLACIVTGCSVHLAYLPMDGLALPYLPYHYTHWRQKISVQNNRDD